MSTTSIPRRELPTRRKPKESVPTGVREKAGLINDCHIPGPVTLLRSHCLGVGELDSRYSNAKRSL